MDLFLTSQLEMNGGAGIPAGNEWGGKDLGWKWIGKQGSQVEMNGEAGISAGNEWGGRDPSWK